MVGFWRAVFGESLSVLLDIFMAPDSLATQFNFSGLAQHPWKPGGSYEGRTCLCRGGGYPWLFLFSLLLQVNTSATFNGPTTKWHVRTNGQPPLRNAERSVKRPHSKTCSGPTAKGPFGQTRNHTARQEVQAGQIIPLKTRSQSRPRIDDNTAVPASRDAYNKPLTWGDNDILP